MSGIDPQMSPQVKEAVERERVARAAATPIPGWMKLLIATMVLVFTWGMIDAIRHPKQPNSSSLGTPTRSCNLNDGGTQKLCDETAWSPEYAKSVASAQAVEAARQRHIGEVDGKLSWFC